MIDSVVKDVWIPATPQAAFRRFTEELDSWWPRATHSVCGERGAGVRFEAGVGGRIVETDVDGLEHVWGTVVDWEPPRLTTFTWHPGRDASSATHVTVTFTEDGEGTRIDLEHGGWEARGAGGTELRESYQSGWDPVIAAYVTTWE